MIKGMKNGKVVLTESDNGKIKISEDEKELVESAQKTDKDIEVVKPSELEEKK